MGEAEKCCLEILEQAARERDFERGRLEVADTARLLMAVYLVQGREEEVGAVRKRFP